MHVGARFPARLKHHIGGWQTQANSVQHQNNKQPEETDGTYGNSCVYPVVVAIQPKMRWGSKGQSMSDFQQAREAMVDTQVRPSDVTRYAIIEALLETPRELFVPKARRAVAYADAEIPLGAGRVLLAPRTFAKMLEAADIGANDLVLDIAPGLGYSTAVLSRLAAAVVAVEPDEAMAKQATDTLAREEYDNAVVSHGDAVAGDADHAPFDVIFINGGVEDVPASLTDQLKAGGRLVAVHMNGPVGKCCVTVKSAQSTASRPEFDASAPVLDGFARAETFTF